jgi:hypothetical protein
MTAFKTNVTRNTLLFLLFAAISSINGAGVPAIDVVVSDASGKVAFKGKTNADGTFSTPNLAPGNYVVQFNSKSSVLKGNQYALVVSAGKKKVAAGAVAGEKFAAGGVAMKVDVGTGLKITGQVASTAAADANVKIINGKRYVWVKGGETGSNIGGRWVEEGSRAASNVRTMSGGDVNRMQEHGDAHQEGFPTGP